MQEKPKLFLITCSKKDRSVLKNFNNTNLSFDNELKNDRDIMMSVLRFPTTHTRIIENVNKNIQNSINCKIIEKANVFYNGSFYEAAKAKCWTKNQASKVYIMSALYGIIRADDYIIKYDLMMTDTLSSSLYKNGEFFTPQKFWRGKLDKILKKIKTDNNAEIYNFLADEEYNTVIDDKKIVSSPKKLLDKEELDKEELNKEELNKEELKSLFTEQINKVK